MKKLFVAAILIAFCASLSFSQETKKIKTLFDVGEVKHSGFGEFSPKITNFDGSAALLVGGGGAWLVNNTFYLGIAGYGVIPGKDKNIIVKRNGLDTSVSGKVMMGYGGLMIGYNFNPEEVFHFSGRILVGAGGLAGEDKDDWLKMNEKNNDNDEDINRPAKAFFIVEPEIMAEANITTFMKIGLSAGYRITGNIDENAQFKKNENMKSMKLDGYTVGLHFIFGGF